MTTTSERQYLILNMDDVKRKHYGHFFDRSTMKFFRSKCPSDQIVFGTLTNRMGYFVTSEQFESMNGVLSDRLWTVRKIDFKVGSINTAGKFQAYETRKKASEAAQILAEHDETPWIEQQTESESK